MAFNNTTCRTLAIQFWNKTNTELAAHIQAKITADCQNGLTDGNLLMGRLSESQADAAKAWLEAKGFIVEIIDVSDHYKQINWALDLSS